MYFPVCLPSLSLSLPSKLSALSEVRDFMYSGHTWIFAELVEEVTESLLRTLCALDDQCCGPGPGTRSTPSHSLLACICS